MFNDGNGAERNEANYLYAKDLELIEPQVDNSAADASALQQLIENQDDEISFGFDILLGRFKPSKKELAINSVMISEVIPEI